MERKIILATHGHFSASILESCEFIMGKQSNVKTLAVVAGMGTDEMFDFFRREIEDSLANEEKLPVVLTDLFGGSPFNQALRIGKIYDVTVIAGLNLPMLIEALEVRDHLNGEELTGHLIDAGKNGISSVSR
jgi:PTS system mannose-specific IIA component